MSRYCMTHRKWISNLSEHRFCVLNWKKISLKVNKMPRRDMSERNKLADEIIGFAKTKTNDLRLIGRAAEYAYYKLNRERCDNER